MKTAVFTLLVLVGVAYSFDCFTCNSKRDSSCGDPFTSDSSALRENFLITCPEREGKASTFCRKTKMYFEVNGETRVHRDCGYDRRENYTCYQERADDHIMEVCQCDKAECNTAADVTTHALVTAIFVSVTGLLLARV